jgi:hypothetical protein
LKPDVREGRVDGDRLVDLVLTLQRALQEARRRIEELQRKSETGRCAAGGSPRRKRSRLAP